MLDYENLGSFYLGKLVDQDYQEMDQAYLYKSKDLTTHAMCVGMTGSGKTGLAISLLEEAAMDEIPALVIDPKGDMSNLLLSFPELRAEDFAPYLEGEGKDPEQVAKTWEKGLASYSISKERIASMHSKVEFRIYTPGSLSGRPVSILKMMKCPDQNVLDDPELTTDIASSLASSLCSLLDLSTDPMTSKEHILLSNIFLSYWKEGKSLDLSSLVMAINDPKMEKIGVLSLEDFFPKKDRQAFALKINGLIASPSFSNWMEGEPLDMDSFLFNKEGKPVISIFSINHLDDKERMFFVSLFLSQMLAWIRRKEGSTSLKYLFYMDEIYGYFPPVENPPSKKPLLTLLKQARAFGLGIFLTTQNPSDLDYKGLSNIGSWFIGRLQTEQDQKRLLDGLGKVEGFSKTSSQDVMSLLSSLPGRVFLVRNVHEDQMLLIHTRWAMSYLAGPMTQKQIHAFAKKDREVDLLEDGGNETKTFVDKPILADEIPQYYLPALESGENFYRPLVYALFDVYVEKKSLSIQDTLRQFRATQLKDSLIPVDWREEFKLETSFEDFEKEGREPLSYEDFPVKLDKNIWKTIEEDLKTYIYRELGVPIFVNKEVGLVSDGQEEEKDFQIRVKQEARRIRDEKMEDFQVKSQTKLKRLEEKVRKQEQAVEREMDQAKKSKVDTAVSFGSALIDGLLGRKILGRTTINKVASTARAANRSNQQNSDVSRAQASLETYQADFDAFQIEMEESLREIEDSYTDIEGKTVVDRLRPKKSDITIRTLCVLWLPYRKTEEGIRKNFL